MKRVFLLLCLVPVAANADMPSVSCPSGYVAIDEEYITIATSCPAGFESAGDAESCLVSNPEGVCLMYAPAGNLYTDDIGTYMFVDACPMEY